MKQEISLEQFKEIQLSEAMSIYNLKGLPDLPNKVNSHIDIEYPTIGQMIEFLDYDVCNINKSIVGWEIKLSTTRNFLKKELVDALWEAVKHKLKQ